MTIEITPQNIITAGAVVTALVLLVARFAKGVRWFDKQQQQTDELQALRAKHDSDVEALKRELADEMHRNNSELQLLTYGVLACLKGLQEKGCNGPVTDAVNKIEKYLNEKAHES